jgi:hypothetical protein
MRDDEEEEDEPGMRDAPGMRDMREIKETFAGWRRIIGFFW